MERIPALDGLRALAIVMVMGYHASREAVPAGFWGVTLFFVLSGYLITRLLCVERDRKGRISIASFYWKRGLRLFPALVVVCVVVLLMGAHWSGVIPTLAYYANYARIGGVDLGLLTHTWSLAVEEHFYLLWPLAIAAIPDRSRLRAIGVLLGTAIVWRAIAIVVMSPGWVYNATDTNAAALLAGCFLAVARPPKWRFTGWAVPAMAVLIFLPVFGQDGFIFLWGVFLAIALAVVAVQHATSSPAWLEVRVVVWLGKISYGLYLWHYVFFRSDIHLALAVVLTVAAAAASWYLVEEPVRRWRGRLEKRRRSQPADPPRSGVGEDTNIESMNPGV